MTPSPEITAPSTASPVVTLHDVEMVSGRVTRLKNVSVQIPAGRTAIVGHSGAGKSSLLSILAGFDRADRGSIQQSTAVANFAMPLFWAPQDNGLWPQLTVRQHLTAVSDPALEPRGLGKTDSSIDKSLQAFDLIHRESAYPTQLSRGEQNRLAVLRCLLANPALILLDEPLIHVDPNRQPRYWNLIEDHLNESKASLIFATHQPEIAVAHSDFCLCLNDGAIAWFGTTNQLYHSAPDQRTAEYLGPNNWFEKAEARAIFGQKSDFISCRPEKLTLSKCDTSDLQIVGTTFSGSYAVTVLRSADEALQKEVIHRPHANVFEVGQSVSLEIL